MCVWKMIKKIRNIIMGWYRYLFKPKSKLARNREQICKRCSYKETLFGQEWCSLCWCLISAKVEVEDEKCNDSRW